MGATPNYGFIYPASSAAPGLMWKFLEDLAKAVDLQLAAVQAGLVAALTPVTARINTSETTASTTYTNLATPGPSVTVTTGTRALIVLTARVRNTGVNLTRMAVDITGASTISSAAAPERSLEHEGTGWQRASTVYLQTGLTAGESTFKAEYRVAAGTGTWEDREVTVIPLL